MNPHRLWPAFVIACLSLLPARSTAQMMHYIQDSLYVDRIVDGDTIPASWFSAAFIVQMHYDTTNTQYTLTEIAKNGVHINLLNWKYEAEHRSWTDSEFADSTRTLGFSLSTGDTITFFRDFSWWNNSTMEYDTTLICEDTLDYAVELVSASSGARVALLDSMGINARQTRGLPAYHGSGPTMRSVSYIAQSLASGQYFLRLRVYTRGPGTVYPVRVDDFTTGWSQRLTNSAWSEYRSHFNYGFTKRSLDELEASDNLMSSSAQLDVTPNPSRGPIEIAYDFGGTNGRTSITVYNNLGVPVFTPAADLPVRQGKLSYQFENLGTYFIVLSVDKTPVRIKKVIVED